MTLQRSGIGCAGLILVSMWLLLLFSSPAAKESIITFPLRCENNDTLHRWIGYMLAEFFFRSVSYLPQVQIWNPTFIIPSDTTVWKHPSEDLIAVHKKRWQWTVCCTGTYQVVADTIYCNLRILHQNNKVTNFSYRFARSDAMFLCKRALQDLLTTIAIEPPKQLPAYLENIASNDRSAFATYYSGIRSEILGQTAAAVSAYIRSTEIDNRFVAAYIHLTELYCKARLWDEAQRYGQEALALAPTDPFTVAAFAELLLMGPHSNKVVAFVESHRSILEASAAGKKIIGLMYVYTGHYQRAISALMRALVEGTSDRDAQFALARTYVQVAEYDKAVELLRNLIECRPGYIPYYTLLGDAYRYEGRFMESCSILERAYMLAPDNVPNCIACSHTYFRLGWYQKSMQFLLKAGKLNPQLDEIRSNLAVVYWQLGRRKEAQELFYKAMQKSSCKQSVYNNQANVFLLDGQVDKAIELYKKSKKSGGENEFVLRNLSRAYRANGKFKESISCLEEILLTTPDNVEVLIEAADVAAMVKKPDAAENGYRKALAIAANQREVRIRLIELLQRQERYNDALELAAQYSKEFPQDRYYRLKVPELYCAMGWYEVALSEYQNILAEKSNTLIPKHTLFLGIGKSLYGIVMHKNNRRVEEAIHYLSAAAAMDSSGFEAAAILGDVYRQVKNDQKTALQWYQAAYARTANDSTRQALRQLMGKALP
ncbi:MAG: tetratricopeptide repeat protein [Chitinivibrionales bacterium]|nr:tetratricopeptide repeat protein [Chitinivibrionales bacterium]